jgi:radical SAM superfamily enzyme YgiQ (UPF0313 family)
MQAVLLSTYDLGHQPFGLSSAAAWLEAAGWTVRLLDLAVRPLDEAAVGEAGFVGFYLPMHTATRLAVPLIRRLRAANAGAHFCAFGLYAPLNAPLLEAAGIDSVIGGEFEEPLVQVARRAADGAAANPTLPIISLAKQRFMTPQRTDLPDLSSYAYLALPDGSRKQVGYTEATRGCKHLCRHCPIVPVYDGRFFIVQRDVVLADIRQQVAAGATHISFGDPDFFNGTGHALAIVRAVHEEFPGLTYDVTIKIEHLLKHQEALATLGETGCLLVTSAVEAVDDDVLARLRKGHTRDDFVRAVRLCRGAGLTLNPTFVAFTPWLTLEGYRDLLQVIEEQDLVEQVAPVQLAIRLLIPAGSRLLELDEVRDMVGAYDEEALYFPWHHTDARVEALHADVNDLVQRAAGAGPGRSAVFEAIRELADGALGRISDRPRLSLAAGCATACCAAAPLVPQFSEPWYCCAEPTTTQRHAF